MSQALRKLTGAAISKSRHGDSSSNRFRGEKMGVMFGKSGKNDNPGAPAHQNSILDPYRRQPAPKLVRSRRGGVDRQSYSRPRVVKTEQDRALRSATRNSPSFARWHHPMKAIN